MTDDMYAPGQCLVCGGRGGWWSAELRETRSRCSGTGWDPKQHEPHFPILRRSV